MSLNSFSRWVGVAFLAVVVSIPPPASAGQNGENGNKPIQSLGDLNGKRLGVLVGTMLDQAANDMLDYTQIYYYENTEAELAALHAGEIDAIIDDQPAIRHFTALDPRLRALPGFLQDQRFAYAMRQEDTEFHKEFNAALRELIADGTFADMERRWFDTPGAESVMPELPPQTATRVLRFGASPVTPPITFNNQAGELVGLDVEVMHHIAKRLDRRLEVVSMEFGELIDALLSGRVDVIGSGLTITREREKIIRFSDSYYASGVSAMVLDVPISR